MEIHAQIPDNTGETKLVLIKGHDTGLFGIGEMNAKGKWNARLYDEDAITELQSKLMTLFPEGKTAVPRGSRIKRVEESLRRALAAMEKVRGSAETDDRWLDEAAGFVAGAAGDLERLHQSKA